MQDQKGPHQRWLALWRELHGSFEDARITVRLLGSAGIALLCLERDFDPCQVPLPRDIDIIVRRKHAPRCSSILISHGATELVGIVLASGGSRERYLLGGLQVDVFIDPFGMCHDIRLGARLTWFRQTLCPGDLLITKAQNVALAERDCLHMAWLLKACPVVDPVGRYLEVISATCGRHWGLWKTVEQNCQYLKRTWARNDGHDFSGLCAQADDLLSALSNCTKSWGWRLRSMLGCRMKWYREVEEV